MKLYGSHVFFTTPTGRKVHIGETAFTSYRALCGIHNLWVGKRLGMEREIDNNVCKKCMNLWRKGKRMPHKHIGGGLRNNIIGGYGGRITNEI